MKKRRLGLEEEIVMEPPFEEEIVTKEIEREEAPPAKAEELPPTPTPETVQSRLAAKARRPRHSKYIPCT